MVRLVSLIVALICGIANAAYCPDGYCRHSTNCYLVVGLNATYIDARAYCGVLGGHLLKVATQANQDTAKGVMKSSEVTIFPGNYWIDATDLLNPTEFKWMADKNALTFTNWAPGFPQGQNVSENCVVARRSDDYQWSTVSCAETNNFICYTAGRSSLPYSKYRLQDLDTKYCLPEIKIIV